MNPYKFKSHNQAAFDIMAFSWATALNNQITAGNLSALNAAKVMEDASVTFVDRFTAFTGHMSDHGITPEEGSLVGALADGEDPTSVIAQPCLSSLAALMGMPVEQLQALMAQDPDAGGDEDEGEDVLGENRQGDEGPVTTRPTA